MTLTHVNGLAVIERQPARYTDGNRPSKNVAVGTIVSSAEELLLEDGTSVFHCAHKNAPDCEYTNPVLNSITSHQRTHSDRMVAKRANAKAEELTAQLAEIEAEKQRKKENYRQGAMKGAMTRAAKQLQTPSEVGGAGNGSSKPGTPTKSVIGDTELARKAQQVILAYNAMQTAADEFQNVFLGYMRAAQVSSERPTVAPLDPAIIEKAKKYDALKGMLA